MTSSCVALLGGRKAEAERQLAALNATGMTGITVRQWHSGRKGWFVVRDLDYVALHSDPDPITQAHELSLSAANNAAT